MNLQEGYEEHTRFFPGLHLRMKRFVDDRPLLDGQGKKIIGDFCKSGFGSLRLDDVEDCKEIMATFKCYVAGVEWALKHWHDFMPTEPPKQE